MRKLLFLLAVLGLLAFLAGRSVAKANETTRAYFRIKTPAALAQIRPYMRHDFGEGVFSIEAPRSVIQSLAKSKFLEFRGEASLWTITEIPDLEELSSYWSTLARPAAVCSPTTPTPWGVTKVNGGSGGASVKVAVADTGVYTNHPDLKANIVDCVDAQYPSLRKRCADGNGHGTHVSGTIAANGKIKGVAPEAKIMAIKVCSNSGLCWSDDVARGIRYAADKGANIVNLSLGGSSLALDEKNAIDYAVGKGVLIVAAAGNSGPADNSINYPGAYYKVVAVGATSSTDAITNWSSRGNNYATTAYLVEERDIEFAAPGLTVESTWRDGCYKVLSGTSMATPHVSGLSAKLWQGAAGTTRTYLQDRARYNYADIGRAGDDPDAGFGLPTVP
ncbi:MAG: S8 family peptidase [Patescibacteria group bacterium]